MNSDDDKTEAEQAKMQAIFRLANNSKTQLKLTRASLDMAEGDDENSGKQKPMDTPMQNDYREAMAQLSADVAIIKRGIISRILNAPP